MTVEALGTIVEVSGRVLNEHDLPSLLVDYCDHWSQIDPRLEPVHSFLSPISEAFAHDVVNLASYAREIMWWLQPDRIRSSEGSSVVSVGAMSESFLVTCRASCDVIASAAATIVVSKSGQAPSDSFRSLLNWCEKNPKRLSNFGTALFERNFEWFKRLRTLRDLLIHDGLYTNIHCDGRQFNLWIHCPQRGWITREPLLPLLAANFSHVMELANFVAVAINEKLEIPADRVGTRAIHGIYIPRLKELVSAAPEYATPSP